VLNGINGLDQSLATTSHIFAVGSSLVVEASLGMTLRVYNVMGQLLINQVVPTGITKIPMQGNQVYIVKSGTSVLKIMIP